MRDELLNEGLFLGLDHARSRIANSIDDYNQRRSIPLWAITPTDYPANSPQHAIVCATPTSSADRCCSTAPHGVKPAEAQTAAGLNLSGRSPSLFDQVGSPLPGS